MRLLMCVLITAAAGSALAQEFEVVSVKPNKSGSNSSHTNSNQGMVRAENLTLQQLIVMAYGLKGYQIVGPRLDRR